eukprot:g9809.t1
MYKRKCRLALRWIGGVIKDRLQTPLPAAHAKRVRALLPLGGVDGESLKVEDLCDGQLLCALIIAVRPEILPKVGSRP